MRLVSPYQPSRMTVTSILTMSPYCRRLSAGMPWQTTWLIEVQIDFGIAAIAERGGDRLVVEDVVVTELVELAGA